MNDRSSKFINHMLWHLLEASFLCHLEAEDSVDPEGKCGPWSPAILSDALLLWLAAGMIHCEARVGWGPDAVDRPEGVASYRAGWTERATIVNSYYIFDTTDSRELLADPALWQYPGIGWFVQVTATPEHLDSPDDEWIAALSGKLDELLSEMP